MPKRNLKLLSFILLPITQIITTPITMIVSLIYFFPYFACVSFYGCPLQPWREIKENLGKVWERSTRDINKYAEKNGHESGSSVDPLVISATIFLWMWKPIKHQYKVCFDSTNNSCLRYYACGFILTPFNIVYAGIVASIHAMIAVLFAFIGLALTFIFTMVGIVPAFILTIGITGVTIITLPVNIYYHALVTYRSVIFACYELIW